MQDPAPRPLLPRAALAGLLGGAAGLPAVAAVRPASPVTPPQSEAEEILRERVGAIGAMGPAEIWREAGRVSALVGDELGADFDAAIDRMLAAGPSTDRARLFLAAMRIDGDDVDFAEVAEAVAPAVRARDEELASAAVDFLGRIGPDISDRDVRRDLADRLLTLARDAAAGIELRASAAMGAYGLGGGSQIVKARRVLKDFLESSDPTLRAAGALGFAEMSSIEEVAGVEDELERLARLPRYRRGSPHVVQLRRT